MEFTQDWFSCNTPLWEQHLKDLFEQNSVHYLEIGTYEGRSLFYMLDRGLQGEGSIATVIDPFFDPKVKETFYKNLQSCPQSQKVQVIEGLSDVELRKLPFQSYDLIFIDGHHLPATVISDAVLSWPLLKEGGYMVFDDYFWPYQDDWPVNKKTCIAIDLFLQAYVDEIEMITRTHQVFIRKKRNPCQNQYQRSPHGDFQYCWETRELFKDNQIIKTSPWQRHWIERAIRRQTPKPLSPPRRVQYSLKKLCHSFTSVLTEGLLRTFCREIL